MTGVLPFLQRAGLIGGTVEDAGRDKIRKVLEACGDRIKIYSDIYQYAAFFFRDPIYDAKAVDKRLRPGAIRKSWERCVSCWLASRTTKWRR